MASSLSPIRSQDAECVTEAMSNLTTYCRSHDWAGWDPYDGLNSRIFQSIPIFRNKPCRLAFIQFMKRSPLNLRPLLLVPPMRNPKGTALFVSILVKQSRLGLADLQEARQLATDLMAKRCPDQELYCWGYHFDWQSRGAMIPQSMPNVVCTAFAGQALLDLFEATRDENYLDTAISAANFVTEFLASDLPEEEFCIRYHLLGRTTVHNASLLGAAFLARVWSHTKEARIEPYVRKAVEYSLRRQRPDGSWPYGEHSTQNWVDSFHTGYNLIALQEIGRHFGFPGLPEAIRSGMAFYRAHFFREDGAVRYFHDNTHPIDAHAVGHALLTLASFCRDDATAFEQALACFRWAQENLLAGDGSSYYYQRHRWFVNRISYMRWSQAWMLFGLTELLRAVAEIQHGAER